jgi:hypothetical protein
LDTLSDIFAWNKFYMMAKKFLSLAIAVKLRISQWSSVTMVFDLIAFFDISLPKNSDWCARFCDSPVPCRHIIFKLAGKGKAAPLVTVTFSASVPPTHSSEALDLAAQSS